MKWLESSTFSKFKLSSTFNCLSDPVYTVGYVDVVVYVMNCMFQTLN